MFLGSPPGCCVIVGCLHKGVPQLYLGFRLLPIVGAAAARCSAWALTGYALQGHGSAGPKSQIL